MATKEQKQYNDAEIIKSAHVLKAISNPIRLKIVCLLCDQTITVQQISEQVGISRFYLSRHLAILRKNILSYKKESNRVYYFIDDESIPKIIALLNLQ